jgi:selenocysteine-specific elongation factor
VLGGDEIAAGDEGWCQLQLSPLIAASAGELLVLRVSDQTVGGGRVVAVNSERYRRSDPTVIERLRALAEGTPQAALLEALRGIEPATAAALAAAAESEGGEIDALLDGLVAEGEAVRLDGSGGGARYATPAGLKRAKAQVARALESYERAHPLRVAMPFEELRARLGYEQGALRALLPALAPAIERRGGGVAREGWEPQPTAAQRRAAEEALATLRAGGSAPPRLDIDGELLAYLEGRGDAVDCGDGVALAREAYDAAREAVTRLIEEQGPLALAQARDALATNRRAAQAILERLDRDGVTVRRGDERVIAAPRSTAEAT